MASQTDNYEFSKSRLVQGEDKYSPYVRKDFNYVNDINSGVYTNSSQSLVQFDLTSIYNSARFTDPADMFFTIPLTTVACFSTGSAAVAPVAGNVNLCSLKSGFHHLIHQADITVNGKTIEQTQPFVNVLANFKLLSEMSQNDLKSMGVTLGFSDELDNPNSVIFNGTTTTANGSGLTNNIPFGSSSTAVTGTSAAGVSVQSGISPYQNAGCVNIALQKRLSNIADTAATGYNKVWGTLMTATQLANEMKPYYAVLNTNYMVWYDVAVIRAKDLFDSMANWGLSKRFDGVLRLYVNTGAVNVPVTNPNLATCAYGTFAIANSTFTNTCPLMVNYLGDTSAKGGVPATTTNIVAGLFIGKPATTALASINLASSGASHPMTSCRAYYSSIEVAPKLALEYITENRAKKIVYRSFVSNQFNNITSGSSFSALVQSGLTSPVGVLIVPTISSQSSLLTAGSGNQWSSPYDTCPATSAPLSLTNLQVAVGGVNQLGSSLYFTYESFLEQVSLFEKLTSSDFGVSCGVINRQWWDMNRHYFVNIRSSPADMATPRNINLSFNNNTATAIDVLVFCIYLDEAELDVETGLVKK